MVTNPYTNLPGLTYNQAPPPYSFGMMSDSYEPPAPTLTPESLKQIWTVLSKGQTTNLPTRQPTSGELDVYNAIVAGGRNVQTNQPLPMQGENYEFTPEYKWQAVDQYGWAQRPDSSYYNIWNNYTVPAGTQITASTVGTPPVDKERDFGLGFLNPVAEGFANVLETGGEALDAAMPYIAGAGSAIMGGMIAGPVGAGVAAGLSTYGQTEDPLRSIISGGLAYGGASLMGVEGAADWSQLGTAAPAGVDPLTSYTFGGAPAPAQSIPFGGPGVFASTIPEAYVAPAAYQIGGTAPIFSAGTNIVSDLTLAPSGMLSGADVAPKTFQIGGTAPIFSGGEKPDLTSQLGGGNVFSSGTERFAPDMTLAPTGLPSPEYPFYRPDPSLTYTPPEIIGPTAPTLGGGSLYPSDIAGIPGRETGKYIPEDPSLAPTTSTRPTSIPTAETAPGLTPWQKYLLLQQLMGLAGGVGSGGMPTGGGGNYGAGTGGGLVNPFGTPIPEYAKRQMVLNLPDKTAKTWQEIAEEAKRNQKGYYGGFLA